MNITKEVKITYKKVKMLITYENGFYHLSLWSYADNKYSYLRTDKDFWLCMRYAYGVLQTEYKRIKAKRIKVVETTTIDKTFTITLKRSWIVTKNIFLLTTLGMDRIEKYDTYEEALVSAINRCEMAKQLVGD